METKLRTGDWVQVRTPDEIAQTLDTDGSLDGLPFMPEMLQYCGRRIRVLRRAEKSCVEFAGGSYKIREFRRNDVVLLEGLRCSGANHGGCQRACMLFWKTAWLQKVDSSQSAAPVDDSSPNTLRSKLKTMATADRYFCQSTELAKATQPLPRSRILLKCIHDIQSGSRGVFEMIWLVVAPLWRKATRRFSRRLVGNLKKTPVENLDLQPGELVEIKSPAEIAQTLDTSGRNRGMICDRGMSQYGCGKYRVRSRLDRMISEPTGEMREVKSTVILEGLECLCWNVMGGCPRQDFMYWREIWLKRVDGVSEVKDGIPSMENQCAGCSAKE